MRALPEFPAGTDHAAEQLPGALGDTAECTAVQGCSGWRAGHSIELITDVFNVLNLFDRNWGVQRSAPSALGDPEMLELVGYDQANQRGIYNVVPVDRNTRDDEATRWRMQLGARYTF